MGMDRHDARTPQPPSPPGKGEPERASHLNLRVAFPGLLAVQKGLLKRGGAVVLACLAVIALTACFETIGTPATGVPGGDAAMGKQAITQYGCGACHTIPGITAAHGNVGPPLTGIADRSFIAGKLRNQPDNMILWIMNPQSVWPGNAMPNMNVTDADARNIAAYLYTLK